MPGSSRWGIDVGTSLKKYNLRGEEIGAVAVSDLFSEAKAHSQLVKDYIVALRANARQWTACTKTRSEMSHSTKKPHPQKGGGRSRQGSLVAPQYRGGGRVFGPKPKPDFHLRVNQKERRAAIKALIADKIKDGRVVVVDSLLMDAPKSAEVRKFLTSCGCTRRVLVLGEAAPASHESIKKSVRNLYRVEFSLVRDVDGYAVALANNVVLSEAALGELEQWLG